LLSSISSLDVLVVPLSFDDHFSTAAVIIPREGQINGHILHFDTIVTDKLKQSRYHSTDTVTALLGDFVARKLAEERAIHGHGSSSSTTSDGLRVASSSIVSPQQLCKFDGVVVDVPAQPPRSQVCGPATLLIVKALVTESDTERLVALSADSTPEKDLLRDTSQTDLLTLCGLSNISSSDYEKHRADLRTHYMTQQANVIG
jgi:hypothetical protein